MRRAWVLVWVVLICVGVWAADRDLVLDDSPGMQVSGDEITLANVRPLATATGMVEDFVMSGELRVEQIEPTGRVVFVGRYQPDDKFASLQLTLTKTSLTQEETSSSLMPALSVGDPFIKAGVWVPFEFAMKGGRMVGCVGNVRLSADNPRALPAGLVGIYAVRCRITVRKLRLKVSKAK